MSFDPHQLVAVQAIGNVLITAGPGAGKTRVLTGITNRILQEDSKSKVVAVTFTNDAACELQERIQEEVGVSIANDRTMVGTFHSLALFLLKRSEMIPSSKIVKASDRAVFLQQAFHSLRPRYPDVGKSKGEVEFMVSSMEALKDDLDYEPNARDGFAAELLIKYQAWMRRHNFMDFSDIMHNAIRYLRDGSVKPFRTTVMLVDEAQDIDPIQYEFIAIHAQSGVQIRLVGDDDQSLYSWKKGYGV